MSTSCVEAVYVYEVTCYTWSYTQTLFPTNGSTTYVPSLSNIQYGYSTSMNSRLMLIGAPNASE